MNISFDIYEDYASCTFALGAGKKVMFSQDIPDKEAWQVLVQQIEEIKAAVAASTPDCEVQA